MPVEMPRQDLIYRRVEIYRWTRERLAAMLGRSPQTIAKWENGERPVPDWMAPWLDYADMFLMRGETPPKVPAKSTDVWAILEPHKAQKRIQKRARRIGRKAFKRDRDRRLAAFGDAKNVRVAGGAKRIMDEMARQLKEVPTGPYDPEATRSKTDQMLRDMAAQLNKLYPKKKP